MNQTNALQPGRWEDGKVPANVSLGSNTLIRGDRAFFRFRSKKDRALVIGEHCTMDGVHFSLGEEAHVKIGDYCCFSNAILMCEQELSIGNYVVIGWNATIADSDFHPISPAQRIADAIACSPLANGRTRPPIATKAVVIEDDVWIGPNVTILKGVQIGRGAFIEPGALITRNVPPGARMLGNPGKMIGEA